MEPVMVGLVSEADNGFSGASAVTALSGHYLS